MHSKLSTVTGFRMTVVLRYR